MPRNKKNEVFEIDHKEKTIVFRRRYTPLMMHAKIVELLQQQYPDYTIIPPNG